eukprot:CAMPEP_0176043300 /NCGR_PEP_ID=MMETSP0120_2-20121206/21487_1 /TAXON_ID=160619 /ORGANISM="Kryptoperidinium foliaceum, Strain CCMP 1326" /LENGTH=482 /DNA_ID=CAMNT_0017376707 /DNA_START=70 /DNA_END=1518 /DNA_ORIENTATION=-
MGIDLPVVKAKFAAALTEFLGTLFLCLTVAATAGNSQIAPIAIGCALMVAVYAGGHVSGGHYNPAVTLAVFLRGGAGAPTLLMALVYVFSQVAGALTGAVLAWAFIGKNSAGYAAVAPGAHASSACLCAAMVTFALSSVVLHTATTKAQAGNDFFGIAIGFTVLSGAVAVGRISGGAFNPAVGSMTILYGGDAAQDVWIYWVGPLFGGLMAAAMFRALAWPEYYDEPPTAARAIIAPSCVEAIGTMFLTFVIGTAGASTSPFTPLADGCALMVMMYMGAWISGAHFNPAVTFAVECRSLMGAKRDHFSKYQALGHLVGQLLGAFVGAWAACGALGSREKTFIPSVPETAGASRAFVGEFVGAFFWCYMALNAANRRRIEANGRKVMANGFFGLAVGMALTSMVCAIGPITGGTFNPAAACMGPFLGRSTSGLGMYWVASILGGGAAAACHRVQNFQEFEDEESDVAKKPVEGNVADKSIGAV